ncbi:hypothetical protein EV360DRAFT_75929 [Lentinula raphanica]|nr:hypothetical protein EV360DRAFT_75929 [Lentinula raphanica]
MAEQMSFESAAACRESVGLKAVHQTRNGNQIVPPVDFNQLDQDCITSRLNLQLNGIAVIAYPVPNQELGHTSPDLSPSIILSEVFGAEGKSTGVKFLTIGPERFCLADKRGVNCYQPPSAPVSSKMIGQLNFASEGEMHSALSEARDYAEKVQYPPLNSEPISITQLRYLNNVVDYLHTISGVVSAHTMESWKGELKASGGEGKLVDSNFSELSPQRLDGDAKGVRFLTIGRQHFCMDKRVERYKTSSTPVSPKFIGFVNFSTEDESRTAFAEARAYAEGVRYPTPKLDPLNYLTFLDNFMEHLHNRTPRAIDDHTMKLWKEKLKELKSLYGESMNSFWNSGIILNEYVRFKRPTGRVAMQIGDNVLSLTTPTTPTDRDFKGEILGPIKDHIRIDFDEVHKHAKLHSSFCGTKQDVERFTAKEAEYRKPLYSKMRLEALMQWKYADGVMDVLVRQGFVSEEISDKWDELCPKRMDVFINRLERAWQDPASVSGTSGGQTRRQGVDQGIAEWRRKQDEERLKALNRGGRRYSYSAYSHALIGNLEIIFNELLKSSNPTGTVSVQFGNEVLSLDTFPTATEGNEWINFESLGSVNRDLRVNFDKVRENAKSHSNYCGTKEDVATFMAFEQESQSEPSSRASQTIAGWKFAISLIQNLQDQRFLSQEASEKWAKLCPKRLHRIIRYINHTNGVDQSAKRTAGQTGSAATSLDPKRQRQN